MLCVMCARVRLGSMMLSALKTQASRHFSGRKIFHLWQVVKT